MPKEPIKPRIFENKAIRIEYYLDYCKIWLDKEYIGQFSKKEFKEMITIAKG